MASSFSGEFGRSATRWFVCGFIFSLGRRDDIKLQYHWPFLRESPGYWWIPWTKGQRAKNNLHIVSPVCSVRRVFRLLFHMVGRVNISYRIKNPAHCHAMTCFVMVILSPIRGWVWLHYNDVIMSTMASHITSVSSIYSTVCSSKDQRKYQSSALLTFVRGIHRWSVNSPHKGSVTRKMFPFDHVFMALLTLAGAFIRRNHR